MNCDIRQEGAEHVTPYRGAGTRDALPQKRASADDCIRAHGPQPPRSPLGRLQLARPRTSEEMRKLAMDVWRQRGLALIDPLLISDDFARQALINEANRLYGRQGLLETGEVR
jgi:hypothetical protein